MKKVIHSRLVGFLIIVLLLLGCSDGIVKQYHKRVEFKSNVWLSDNSVEFNFNIKNPDKLHRIVVGFHTTDEYNYSNVWLFTENNFGQSVRIDTLECSMSDLSGKWYGNHTGKEVDTFILLSDSIEFKKDIKYKLKIVQAMRETELQEVISVSLNVLELPNR